jgi:hypothetical protein
LDRGEGRTHEGATLKSSLSAILPELAATLLMIVGVPWFTLRMAAYVEGNRVAVSTFGIMTYLAVGCFVLGGYLGGRAGRRAAMEEAKLKLRLLGRAFDDAEDRPSTAVIRSCPTCAKANRIPMKFAFQANVCMFCQATIPTSAEGIGTEYAGDRGQASDGDASSR